MPKKNGALGRLMGEKPSGTLAKIWGQIGSCNRPMSLLHHSQKTNTKQIKSVRTVGNDEKAF